MFEDADEDADQDEDEDQQERQHEQWQCLPDPGRPPSQRSR